MLFRQERLGRNEEPFTILKLRTMTHNAEAETGPVWSRGASDVRVTRVGRFLRRTRIDELPQLLNVLQGDMAMVGPRPERAFFVEERKAAELRSKSQNLEYENTMLGRRTRFLESQASDLTPNPMHSAGQ